MEWGKGRVKGGIFGAFEVGETAGGNKKRHNSLYSYLALCLLVQRPLLPTCFQTLELLEECRRLLTLESKVSHFCPDLCQPCLAPKMEHIWDSMAVDEVGLPNHTQGYCCYLSGWPALRVKRHRLKIQTSQPVWSQATTPPPLF